MIGSHSATTFSQEQCQTMNYETATILRGRKCFCGRNLKKKTQNILCVTWYLCRGKKEGKKKAAYRKPADVAVPLGFLQLLDQQLILRQLLRIWKQTEHLYFWCFKRKWLHGAVSTFQLLHITTIIFSSPSQHRRKSGFAARTSLLSFWPVISNLI